MFKYDGLKLVLLIHGIISWMRIDWDSLKSVECGCHTYDWWLWGLL